MLVLLYSYQLNLCFFFICLDLSGPPMCTDDDGIEGDDDDDDDDD